MNKEVAQHKFKAKERFQLYFKCLKISRLSTFGFLIMHLVLISCSYQNIQKQGKLVRAEAFCSFEKMFISGTKEYQLCIQKKLN
jgi:hypothetical protein